MNKNDCYHADLDSIQKSVRRVKNDPIHGKWFKDAVEKILSCSDSLSAEESCILVAGLEELTHQASVSLHSQNALVQAIRETSPNVVTSILQRPVMQRCTSQVFEELVPFSTMRDD